MHDPKQRPGLDFLIGFGFGQPPGRAAAAGRGGGWKPARLRSSFLADTLAAIQEPQSVEARTLGDWRAPWLRKLLEELNRAAADNLEDYAHLHQVRIIGKRLRYAMEVFAPCFAPAFRAELYPRVEAMQEILGPANDSHVATERLVELAITSKHRGRRTGTRFRPAIERLLRSHRQRLPRERRRFVQWWKKWQVGLAEEKWRELRV